MIAMGGLRRTFRSLSVRNYRLFWGGQLISLAGTWMQEVALAWLVLQLSDSPLALGLSLAVRFVPSLVLTLFAGPLIDRVCKRRILLAAQSTLLVQALALAVLTTTGVIRLEHIYILALIRGLADAFDVPTRQAFVMELVGPKHLANAVALNSTQFNTARVAGPALGGLLIALFGVSVCFWLNALSFIPVLAALIALRPAELRTPPRRKRQGVLREVREGLVFSLRTPDILLVLLLVGFLGTFGYNFTVVLPLVARYLLDSGPSGLGALSAALGVGSTMAGVAVAAWARPSRRNLLLGAAGFSLFFILLGMVRDQTIALVLLVAIGMCGVLFLTSANSRLQLAAPDELRGRVMSIYIFVFAGSTPLGSAAVGWLAERGGVRAAVLEVGSLCMLGVLLCTLYLFFKVRGASQGENLKRAAAPPARLRDEAMTEAA